MRNISLQIIFPINGSLIQGKGGRLSLSIDVIYQTSDNTPTVSNGTLGLLLK